MRAVQLVPRERVEIGAESAYVDGAVRCVGYSVDGQEGAGDGVDSGGDGGDIGDGAENVRSVSAGHQFGLGA